MPGYYGGGPITISDDRNDDDLGFLLAILLLASRRGCGGGCGGCGGGTRVVPIPYPIPFPMGPGASRSRSKFNFKDLKKLNPIFVYDSLEGDSNLSKNDGKHKSHSASVAGSIAIAESQSADDDSGR